MAMTMLTFGIPASSGPTRSCARAVNSYQVHFMANNLIVCPSCDDSYSFRFIWQVGWKAENAQLLAKVDFDLGCNYEHITRKENFPYNYISWTNNICIAFYDVCEFPYLLLLWISNYIQNHFIPCFWFVLPSEGKEKNSKSKMFVSLQLNKNAEYSKSLTISNTVNLIKCIYNHQTVLIDYHWQYGTKP